MIKLIKRWLEKLKIWRNQDKSLKETEEVIYDITNEQDRERYIGSICEQIKIAREDNHHLQPEYQKLCSQLSDYQKIEQLPNNLIREIEEKAIEIEQYNQEKIRYQGASELDPKYDYLKPLEDKLEESLDKVKELEERQSLIKRDIEHLEGEKAELSFQRRRLVTQQMVVRVITIVFFSFFSLLALLFMTLMTVYEKDVLIPSIVLIFFAIFYVMFIFTFRRKMLIKTIRNDKQQVRAAELLNKVKIKYVNTTNFLEYEYKLFKVNSSDELRFLWETYTKQQREHRVFQQATYQLSLLEEELIHLLKKYAIENAHQLLGQLETLASPEARQEKITSLSETVAKLKEQIQYHHSVIKTAFIQLNTLIKHHPEQQEAISHILEKNKISLKELDK